MDRATYFQEKQEKQLQQSLKPVTSLFKDCIFYINGFTKPWSRIKLIQNIQLNGGIIKPFPTGSVTHILSQQWNYRWTNKTVVDSKWVIDSIAEKRLLPISDYSLKPLEVNQNLITDRFTKLNGPSLVVDSRSTPDAALLNPSAPLMQTPNKVSNLELNDPVPANSIFRFENSDYLGNENNLTGTGNLQDRQTNKGTTSIQLTTNGRNNDHLNCNAPIFISNYFNHSRLHLISNWKQTLRDNFVNNLQDEKTKIPKGITKNKEDYVFIYMDFDCFFVNVSYINYLRQNSHSHLNIDKDPIVVCHGNQHSDIASCNYVARSFGIKNGMWVTKAKELLPGGIKLTILPYVFDDYKKVSSKLYETLNESFKDWFNKFIIPMSIDECFTVLERSKFGNNYQDLWELCKSIKQKILETTTGCPMSIGVGNSFINAKLSLKLAKPKGIHFWNQDLSLPNMDWTGLQISDIPGLGYASLNKLPDYLKTLDDLSGLPLIQLKKYLGDKLGEKVSNQLKGIDDQETDNMLSDPINYFQRKSISVDINYAIRFQSIAQVDIFIDRLTEYLLERLDSKTLIKQLSLKIMKRQEDQPIEPIKFMGMGICQAFNNNANLPLPTRDIGIIATELKNLFRKISVKPIDVRGLGVQFNKLSKARKDNKDFAEKFFVGGNLSNGKEKTSDYSWKNNDKSTSPLKTRRLSPLKRSKIYNPQFGDSMNSFDHFQSTYQQEFISELPTQMRNEISNQIRIERKAKQTKLNDLKNRIEKRNQPQDVSHFMHSESIFLPICFQKITRFKKICEMIDKWVEVTMSQSTGPHADDVRLFEKYLLKLTASSRKHLILRICNIVSNRINISSQPIIASGQTQSGLQEWDRILLKVIIPILKKDNQSLQVKRRLNVEYDV